MQRVLAFYQGHFQGRRSEQDWLPGVDRANAFLAEVRTWAFNELCTAFDRHGMFAGLDGNNAVTHKPHKRSDKCDAALLGTTS